MIECETCKAWYHGERIEVTEEQYTKKRFECERCKEGERKKLEQEITQEKMMIKEMIK